MADPTAPLLETWIEESRTVQTVEPDVEFDNQGYPQRVTMKPTQKEVKERVIYTALTDYQTACGPDSHHFVFANGGKRQAGRLAVECRRCGVGKDFVLGRDRLVAGQLLPAEHVEL